MMMASTEQHPTHRRVSTALRSALSARVWIAITEVAKACFWRSIWLERAIRAVLPGRAAVDVDGAEALNADGAARHLGRDESRPHDAGLPTHDARLPTHDAGLPIHLETSATAAGASLRPLGCRSRSAAQCVGCR